MKKAAIYSPYWDTLGGGEKYTAAVILALLEAGYATEIFWHNQKLLKDISLRYNFDLSQAKVNQAGFKMLQSGSLIDRYKTTSKYDLIFYVSDGSIPFLFSRQSIIHFQVPFNNYPHNPLISTLKKSFINTIVCNSKFTRRVIDKSYGVNSKVLYPPASKITPRKKQNYILSVGRFDNLMHSKRQDALIKSFQDLNLKGWKLVLAGGVLHGSKDVKKLKKIANKRVEFEINPSWKKLESLYSHATIYWHAAGFEQDLKVNPEKAEHFGISTVEAMSAGAVPLVFNGGGLPEIVTHHKNGFLWNNQKELVSQTNKLVKNKNLLSKISKQAITRSSTFSIKAFKRDFITNVLQHSNS